MTAEHVARQYDRGAAVCRGWQVNLGGVNVGGTDLALEATQAVLDTGTSAIVMSDQDAFAINGVCYLSMGYLLRNCHMPASI